MLIESNSIITSKGKSTATAIPVDVLDEAYKLPNIESAVKFNVKLPPISGVISAENVPSLFTEKVPSSPVSSIAHFIFDADC